MTPAPKRRWTYSLRTMFVVVTVVASWLGWNVHVVHQRQAMWRAIREEDEYRRRIMSSLDQWGGFPYLRIEYAQHSPTVPTPLPLIRRLLGDEPRFRIERNTKLDAVDTKQLFPEAEIIYHLESPNGITWVDEIIRRAHRQPPAKAPPS
jgi:hypothetical protein